MTTILIILHIIVSLFLIVIVLLQHGKGADIGATFGGSSQTVFGTEGPLPLLNKVTTGAAIIFMVTSISLAWYSAQASKRSVMRGVTQPPPVQQKAPAPAKPLTVPMPQRQSGGQTFPGAPGGKGQP
ncbi:MAG: preprotein translocase subunit SecG [Desulfobacteraceae bacterium]|nr:preprotein translocase subunit SecG [Desulfobacteraceae bacterium]